ncbi:hypothetical protein HLRTI_002389 [Halorhabdus tiamatea SARL4B]|uniref:Uncharacterized protein n=1 Tax=Halorhabdus tiamatea SARL4B TaxID=1033806 RepID=F7PH34_9EURY|nr:hypothetical protein [Halorhabdus tiamatea]ERJ05661.1 hypothetical protein HLRTI_002389 [Halorhabdus tiamatea SARL4B]CCQ32451.1 conserved hypothetical protein [Halorhabdus tiamatea SARL4B]
MPEISITDRQEDRLDDVRREVEAAYVETYGETRPQDAIEYLLDTYTPPEQRAVVAAYEEVATATYPTLQQIASDVDEVPGSGIEAAEMRGRLLAALGPETLAERLRAVGTETDDDVSTADDATSDLEFDSDSPPEAPAGSPADEDSPTTTGESSQGESETDTDGADESSVDGGESPSGSQTESTSDGQAESAPASPLASANKLLDDHSEKWRQGDGDAPYEVDLPDGTTKAARTKDDVRQLLFRHY